MPGRDVLQVLVSTHRRGAETFAIELERELQGRGHAVRSVALAPGDAAGYSLPTLGSTRVSLATIRGVRREARSAGAVVAHGSNTLPVCAIATSGTGVPFAYRNIGDPTYWSSSFSRRARVGFSLRRAARVAVLWPGAADAIIRQHGVRPDRIRIIPNGVPAGRFLPVDETARADARSGLGLSSEEPVILYIGALSREKNVGSAIRAVGGLTGGRLVIVGEGPDRAALEALAMETAPRRVTFFGPTPDVQTVLAAADVLVLASETEGMPGVLIEAGLSALPVVATDVGAVATIVRHGDTGILVAPGRVDELRDALAAVLADPGDLGRNARAHCAAHFDLAVVAGLWEDLLGELLA